MNNTYDFKIARPDIIKQLSVKDMLFYAFCWCSPLKILQA